MTSQQVDCDQSSTIYGASNSSSSSFSWPTDQYWVVSANSERAFGPEGNCSDSGPNTGPPNQSKKVQKPGQGVFGVEIKNGRATLSVDTLNFPNCVASPDKAKISFLSLGAQTSRGYGRQPITFLKDPDQPAVLGFRFNIDNIAPVAITSSLGKPRTNYGYVFIESQWGGLKRWVFLILFYRGASHPQIEKVHWNWNIAESMWAPGAEIIYIPADTLLSACPNHHFSTSLLRPIAGASQDYSIDLNQLFDCIDSFPQSLGWSTPRPGGSLPITGIHWATEHTFGTNLTQISAENISLLEKKSAELTVQACADNWETQGMFYCESGAEKQRICGCNPPLYDNPQYWQRENNNCFSHLTGKSCGAAHCNLSTVYNGVEETHSQIQAHTYYGYSWTFEKYQGLPAPVLPSGATAYWMGTKNGVADLTPGQAPQALDKIQTGVIYEHTGTPQIIGDYTRYLVIKDASGNTWCQSNEVFLKLNP